MMGEAPGDDKGVLLRRHRRRALQAPDRPGDQPDLDVSLDRIKGGIYKFKGVARVGAAWPAEAEIICTMRTVMTTARVCRAAVTTIHPGGHRRSAAQLDPSVTVGPYAVIRAARAHRRAHQR